MMIRDGVLTVGIIGAGYVGLPNAVYYAERGANVILFDVNDKVVETINAGKSHIKDVPSEVLSTLVRDKKITATTDFSEISTLEYIFICIPTPLKESSQEGSPQNPQSEKTPDYIYLDAVTKSLIEYLPKATDNGVLIFLESTVAPGDTYNHLILPLQEQGFELDKDVYVCFFPERISPGSTFNFRDVSRVLGGSELAIEKARGLFTPLGVTFNSAEKIPYVQPITTVSSIEAAELTKVLENTYRFVNIALANEFAKVAERIGNGVDITEVIEAAGTKPYGFQKFYPNIKIGGHCIPIDPYYLYNTMQKQGFQMPLLAAAGAVNDSMLDTAVREIVQKISNLDEQNNPNYVKIAVIGASYKKNIEDTRESAAFVLKSQLEDLGHIRVEILDPIAYPETWVDDYTGFDLTVLLVLHDCLELSAIKANSRQFMNFDFSSRYKEKDI
jgi:UDP-N-acetyl-D-glucosamine dehydrogenase